VQLIPVEKYIYSRGIKIAPPSKKCLKFRRFLRMVLNASFSSL
jgi:hypothetical protein